MKKDYKYEVQMWSSYAEFSQKFENEAKAYEVMKKMLKGGFVGKLIKLNDKTNEKRSIGCDMH